jgi:nitrile hydratase
MNAYRSHADIGGTPGHGRVVPEPETERFHASWERGALAVTLAMGATGAWNLDMVRSARETLPDYPALDYYSIWIAALTRMLVERALVHEDELKAGRMLHPSLPLPRVLKAGDVAQMVAHGAPTLRPAKAPARFAVGDAVRARAHQAPHHTRLPGYARGKVGRIARVLGVHVYADSHAHDRGEDPQWLYTVAFAGTTLWPDEPAARLTVSIDAWEPYLEPARSQ